MNSTTLTEKQQEVLWMRYGQNATIEQIAIWLKISRRAVLARLHNARRRSAANGQSFPIPIVRPQDRAKPRMFTASQLTGNLADGSMDMGQL